VRGKNTARTETVLREWKRRMIMSDFMFLLIFRSMDFILRW
jgi:hypothetical protein